MFIVGRRRGWGMGMAKKRHRLSRGRLGLVKKVVSFFLRKNSATPCVAAPGDTHPSDATASNITINDYKTSSCSFGCYLVINPPEVSILKCFKWVVFSSNSARDRRRRVCR